MSGNFHAVAVWHVSHPWLPTIDWAMIAFASIEKAERISGWILSVFG